MAKQETIPQMVQRLYPNGGEMERVVDGKRQTRFFGPEEMTNQLIHGRSASWGWKLAEEEKPQKVAKPSKPASAEDLLKEIETTEDQARLAELSSDKRKTVKEAVEARIAALIAGEKG